MTPAKEKAKELFYKFYLSPDEDGFHSVNKFRAKNNALIAVDLIIDNYPIEFNTDYWQDVKEELLSL